MQKYHLSENWKRLKQCAKGRYCRDFWTYANIARYYGISASTLYKMGKREEWEKRRSAWWCELMEKHTVKGAVEYRRKKAVECEWLFNRKAKRLRLPVMANAHKGYIIG